MSESASLPDEFVSVSATSNFESDEEALEALVQLKDTDFGEALDNRETQLDSGEGESIRIRFFDDDSQNSLSLTTGPESNVRVSLFLTSKDIYESPGIFDKIVEKLSDLSVDDVQIYKEYAVPFRSLQLPITEDPEYDVTGIKIAHGGAEWVIQETEDATSVHALWDDLPDDAAEIISDIGESHLEQSTTLIESLQ